MKLILTATVAAALALIALPKSASAQAVGVSANYDGDLEELGLGANFVFHTGGVVDSSRVAVDVEYWLVDDPLDVGLSVLGANFNGQYLFYKGPQALSYGLVGLNYILADNDFGSNSDLGINLGIGGEFTLANNIAAYGEGKLVVSLGDIGDRIVAGAGVRFYFGGGGGGGSLNLSDF